jgi:hypothetical protein
MGISSEGPLCDGLDAAEVKHGQGGASNRNWSAQPSTDR